MARMDSRETAKRASARRGAASTRSAVAPVDVTPGDPDVLVAVADLPTAVPVPPAIPPTAPVPGLPPTPVAPAVPVATAAPVLPPAVTPRQATCLHTVTRTRQRAGKLWRYCEECGYEVPADQAPREVLRPLTDLPGSVGRLGG